MENLLNFLSLDFLKLGVFFCCSVVLATIIYLLSANLTVNNPDVQKLATYECGFEPYEDARNVFDVRFYLVAILFLIFDLEAVYFFPWCLSLGGLTDQGFWLMIDFIFELLVGYVYAWHVGALDWN